jgi:hypothetical protein
MGRLNRRRGQAKKHIPKLSTGGEAHGEADGEIESKEDTYGGELLI